MKHFIVAGSAHRGLADSLCRSSQIPLADCEIISYPDGEVDVSLNTNVREADVFIVQPLGAPVGEHLLEFSLLVDCCKRRGAKTVTGIISYLGYARHDRRETGTEPLGARVIAELIAASGVDRIVCVDLHSRAVEGCFAQPVEHVSAVKLLAARLKDVPTPRVVVSPDLGAVKRAEMFAHLLGTEVAIVHKHRISGSEVESAGVVGDVVGKFPILIDDMIATGGTLEAAAKTVMAHGSMKEITIAATHGLFVGPALERLSKLPIKNVVVTNSLPIKIQPTFKLEQLDIAPLIARVIEQL